MPKKAPKKDEIDPVRARLAGAVSTPAPVRKKTSRPQEEAIASPSPSVTPSPEPEPEIVAPRTVKAKKSPSSRMTVNRKFMITTQEADQMKETLDMFSKAFGGKVTYSQLSRAFWAILAMKEDVLQSIGRRSVRRSSPSTGDVIGMAEYEEDVTEFLEAVMKRS